tara:strand:+ start:389 stop:1087 length:699 start_codon:yes stop_codon:yes gene_type:complete
MGPLARFLLSLNNLVRSGGIKRIEEALEFARNEFGKITPLLQKQIEQVFKRAKKPETGGKKQGDVVPFKKEKEGIQTLDEFPDTRDNPLQPFDKDLDEFKLPKNPLDPAIGITRTAVRTILNKKGIDIAKGEDPIEIFRKTFGQDVLIDVNNVSEELLEMERMGKGFKGLDEILEQQGFFDLKIPKDPPQGMTNEELLKFMEEVEQEEVLKNFDPKGRKPSATGGIAGILNL